MLDLLLLWYRTISGALTAYVHSAYTYSLLATHVCFDDCLTLSLLMICERKRIIWHCIVLYCAVPLRAVLCCSVVYLARESVCVYISLSFGIFRLLFLFTFCSFRCRRRQCRLLLLLLLLLFNNRWKSAYTWHIIAIENSVQFITACWSEHNSRLRRGRFWAWIHFWLPSPLFCYCFATSSIRLSCLLDDYQFISIFYCF